MKNECRISPVDSFAPFRDRNMYGIDPMACLQKKLAHMGIRVTIDSTNVVPEDLFYLEEEEILQYIHKKKAYVKITDELSFYNAMCAIKRQINIFHLRNQVRILNIEDTYIDANATIGKDTVIYPGTFIEGECIIGEGCVIGPNTRIVDTGVGELTTIIQSVVLESLVGKSCSIGPFSYIRPETVLEDKVKVGDFVEIKKSNIAHGTKIPHLAYIGDARIGRNTNIACGVITANYDGIRKHRTIIGDNCFVGCNTTLVAPVTVERDSYIAAGSTITEPVGEGSLAIARERQVNKEGWVSRTGHGRMEKE
ncbi:MAG: DapH/DapD/GlmU-related protein [Clostridia bacterium]